MNTSIEKTKERRLVAVIACRNDGSRLYGKPLQNLDTERHITILDNIIDGLKLLPPIESIVLAISEGASNQKFIEYATKRDLLHFVGDENDVLSRLVLGGRLAGATDVFRVTSESPFLHFEFVEDLWAKHLQEQHDATFLDDVIDGCGFEIIRLKALEDSHVNGEDKHRSELCTLYIREHPEVFNICRILGDESLNRQDLRLTVDNPEDLIVCREVYRHFKDQAPRIPVRDIIKFLDDHPFLKQLTAKYTQSGYSQMYAFGSSNEA